MLDADEKMICDFLKTYPGQYVSGREICRRAGGKWRFREDEKWALPVLQRLLEKNELEADPMGHFRWIKKHDRKSKKKWWASPQIKKILQQSGRQFEGVIDVEKDVDDEK